MVSSIRIGDYKLIRNYNDAANRDPEFELYRLYDSRQGTPQRIDIEESHNLIDRMPEKTEQLKTRMEAMLAEMEASYPYWNPGSEKAPARGKQVPQFLSHQQHGSQLEFKLQLNGPTLECANLIYSTNGGGAYEEWFRQLAVVANASSVQSAD